MIYIRAMGLQYTGRCIIFSGFPFGTRPAFILRIESMGKIF